MTGYITLSDGSVVTLPRLTAWELELTSGVPCESFWVRFLWTEDWEDTLHRAVGFFCQEDGARIFTGVVDEYTLNRDSGGKTAELSGRGMAARLLDNEAVTAEYLNAATGTILRNHVLPYGIEVAEQGNLSAVPGFSMNSGSSEWKVLYTFARQHNGITPRFDEYGRLHLTPFPAGEAKTLDRTVPITELRCRETRYGVLSQVVVKYRSSGAVVTVDNEDFLANGGSARQVITTTYATSRTGMKTSAQYQIDRSKEEQYGLEVSIPLAFWAKPGDRVETRLDIPGWDKLWTVKESRYIMDDSGIFTHLMLTPMRLDKKEDRHVDGKTNG